jgi:DNA repair protein RecO (recombination protein O)
MRIEKSEAIILHTYSARERDKVVVFLTPDHGKRKGFAYGARAIRSRFGASLEPLAKVRIGYSEREGEELLRVESVDLIRSLFPAQQHLATSVAATYLAEMVDTFAPAGDPAELIYRLLDRSCEALLDGVPPLLVVSYVEVWMLRLAGIFPSFDDCTRCDAPLDRPLRYDPSLQGFVCRDCATRDTSIVNNDAIGAIDTIFRSSIAKFAGIAPPLDVLLDVRALAGDIRRAFLGYELKSFEVLASVAR